MVLELPDKRGIVAEVSAMSRAVVVPRQASPLRSRKPKKVQGAVECIRGLQTQMLLMQYGQSLMKKPLCMLQVPPYLKPQNNP